MLKPYYRSEECMNSFPDDYVEGQISMSEMGVNLIRCFIYLPAEVSQEDTKKADGGE